MSFFYDMGIKGATVPFFFLWDRGFSDDCILFFGVVFQWCNCSENDPGGADLETVQGEPDF